MSASMTMTMLMVFALLTKDLPLFRPMQLRHEPDPLYYCKLLQCQGDFFPLLLTQPDVEHRGAALVN